MEKKLKCKGCGKKDFENKLIKNKYMNHNGKDIFVYYHQECIGRDKQIYTEHSNGLLSKESYKHKLAKELVFDWIMNHGITLVDQNGKESSPYGDFIAVESPVTSSLEYLSPYHNLGSCENCFDNSNLLNEDCSNLEELYKIHKINDNKVRETDWDCYNGGYYKLHPCINCKLNNFTYKYIFDIGIASKGTYHTAVEILNTSKVKDDKLRYCAKNNIDLFEIKADYVMKQTNIPKYIECERLWWEEDGKYYVSDNYKHLADTYIN